MSNKTWERFWTSTLILVALLSVTAVILDVKAQEIPVRFVELPKKQWVVVTVKSMKDVADTLNQLSELQALDAKVTGVTCSVPAYGGGGVSTTTCSYLVWYRR